MHKVLLTSLLNGILAPHEFMNFMPFNLSHNIIIISFFQRLKQDLSTEALKSIHGPTIPETTPITSETTPTGKESSPTSDEVTEEAVDEATEEATPSSKKRPRARLHRHSSGCIMLDQLLADICNTIVVSDEQVRVWGYELCMSVGI